MADKFILLIPGWAVGPDGTLLWPRQSECGCILEDVIAQKVKEPQKTGHVHVVVTPCKLHYAKAVQVSAEDDHPYAQRWEWYKGEFLPKMHTDEL